MGISHFGQQKGSFTSLLPLYKEAIRCGFWLYSKETGKWYTPEEFYQEFKKEEYTNHRITLILENVVIRDPIGGIEAGHKQLHRLKEKNRVVEEDLEAKLEAFSKKAIDYYQKKGIIRS
ncbi:hypothetical protein AQ505_16750 [Pedobacter sp. PACM 27299]|uniref:hypothetical protein n=1 Tax=Pedobacter sp. PACM 27299 TaxID=1727164 RepID=UPI0007065D99|nr:hypothetical protein [Pedobacter sp. PACM 27299]ALL06989.1 hypothetical protein AQ505_16750 [Pedobacter sp. PACM 27299]